VSIICEIFSVLSAIRKYGTEEYLKLHLEQKRTAAKGTYSQRAVEYREAVNTRTVLESRGNLDAASAVVLGSTGRKIPKAFPAYPAILTKSSRPFDRSLVCFATQELFLDELVVVNPAEEA
jgi:hypothetical protein